MNKWSKFYLVIMSIILIILAFSNGPVLELGIVLIILTMLFSFDLKKIDFSKIKALKVGTNGLELERITEEAKQAIEELKNLAVSVYKPILQIPTKLRTLDSLQYSILEMLELKKESRDTLLNLGINEKEIEKLFLVNNNVILRDILMFKVIDKLSNNDLKKLIADKYSLGPYKLYKKPSFNPDIDAIEKEIDDAGLLDDEIKQILEEARYFQKNKDIKTPSLFEE